MNPTYQALGTTIFTTMSGLATELNAVNLGQGFPETDGFWDVRQKASEDILTQSNQYAPMKGLKVLQESVSQFYGKTQNLRLDPAHQVLITSGATEAIACALFALISEGDEVIVFEPMYDAYKPLIERAGGKAISVRLNPPEWSLSHDILAKAFSKRTKLVLVTTPNNPTTGVFSPKDWDLLAQFAIKYQTFVVSDEVWEQVIFEGQKHLGVLNIKGLETLGVKIGSAGKIFALTGWKIGFVCGSETLITQIAKAHQFMTFSTPPALQSAVAFGLNKPLCEFDEATKALERSRNLLRDGLEAEGFKTLPAKGTYFLNIDLPTSGIALGGYEFALRAVNEFGVAVIPLDAFCTAQNTALPIIRLCFAKQDQTLLKGIDSLKHARKGLI
jgi:N-succinyldiaminopimelate aminotransferase